MKVDELLIIHSSIDIKNFVRFDSFWKNHTVDRCLLLGSHAQAQDSSPVRAFSLVLPYNCVESNVNKNRRYYHCFIKN